MIKFSKVSGSSVSVLPVSSVLMKYQYLFHPSHMG